ncbi:glycolipid transfer protein [Danaus plexippus]|uniref:glycolipid transfer protein n=1 Tax=Danaus plexippus TaxID=13037 RepID=UPI002AAF4238|nr:glycolipid transfer protein [Danaus plexippus]XP_061383400.1 glycolipid transfer protein [Danaus plexippus]XP_061383402.1 glycolipid transfer protein [Danaus plexippus]
MKMAGSSLEDENRFNFNAIKSFPTLVNDKINVLKFLEATSDLIMVVDRLGKVFAPVKYDMQGNVDKIKNHYEYNEDTCLLELMLDEYSKGKNTAAEGVLWLNRALLFFELLFQEMLVSLQAKDYEVSMKKIFTVAYEGSVKKYHSWITQQLFNFMCKMSPTFIQILKSFEVENDLKGFEMQLANFNATLHGVRSKIDEFFETNPVCDL